MFGARTKKNRKREVFGVWLIARRIATLSKHLFLHWGNGGQALTYVAAVARPVSLARAAAALADVWNLHVIIRTVVSRAELEHWGIVANEDEFKR